MNSLYDISFDNSTRLIEKEKSKEKFLRSTLKYKNDFRRRRNIHIQIDVAK